MRFERTLVIKQPTPQLPGLFLAYLHHEAACALTYRSGTQRWLTLFFPPKHLLCSSVTRNRALRKVGLTAATKAFAVRRRAVADERASVVGGFAARGQLAERARSAAARYSWQQAEIATSIAWRSHKSLV